MEKIQYKLDVFEGPLDLLLHLINKHKLNINDIPILQLVEQYVEYVQLMQESDMEVASEFLEMAARLVYIKSVSLLPVHQEAQQLKKELTGELIEYRDCKLMAKEISKQADGFDHLCRKPAELPNINYKYERLHESNSLLKYYLSAVGRGKRKLPPPFEAFTAIVTKKIVSVGSRVSGIFSRLKNGKKNRFIDFFTDAGSRSELVATFLAMLELIKANKIRVNDDSELLVEQIGELDEIQTDFEYGGEDNG